MVQSLARGLDGLMKKYTPDPLIYALFLTVLTLILGMVVRQHSFIDALTAWGSGFWALTDFTLQMVMILFLGYVLALSAPIKWSLKRLADLPKNLGQAAVLATLVSLVGCILNWGFGLIIAALFCNELGRRFNGRGFSILLACSYSGFLVWHGGLSGSIPLVVSTPGNFNEALLGSIVPLSQTVFSPLNLAIVALHFIFLPLLAYYLMRTSDQNKVTKLEDQVEIHHVHATNTPAERLETSPVIPFLVVAMALSYMIFEIWHGKFRVDLNKINFALFALALLFHKTPRKFIYACQEASAKIWPLLIQYPLYAGIMAIMVQTGLAEAMSQLFVDWATEKTLPLLVFYSAGLVNIFIPSGGGQWAVQGPMVISAAKALGSDMNATMMAVAWGDSWTNMIQPFWALPLLTIAGLKAKDIMGPLVFVFLLSGLIISSCFILLV